MAATADGQLRCIALSRASSAHCQHHGSLRWRVSEWSHGRSAASVTPQASRFAVRRDNEMEGISRRSVGLGMAAVAIAGLYDRAGARAESITLPFGNGERPLVKYPQKRPLIQLTSRPPQLETPFYVYAEGPITPNDAFFVRYHLAGVPYDLDPEKFALKVKGKVDQALSLSLADLRRMPATEIVAVNQCSGNSRG